MNTPTTTPSINFVEMIEQVERIFVGREIAIAHTDNSSLKDCSGKCVSIAVTNRATGHVDFILASGARVGLHLKSVNMDKQSCSGDLGAHIAGSRSISVIRN